MASIVTIKKTPPTEEPHQGFSTTWRLLADSMVFSTVIVCKNKNSKAMNVDATIENGQNESSVSSDEERKGSFVATDCFPTKRWTGLDLVVRIQCFSKYKNDYSRKISYDVA